VRSFRIPGRALAVLAVVSGSITSSAMIMTASYSAFTGATTNPSSAFSAGTVVLADDDTGSAMFTTSAPGANQTSGANLKPGQSVVNCIKVTYTGSVAATVRMYVTSTSEVNGSGGTGLLAYLHVKVEEGTAGAFGCSGFAGASTIWDTSTHPGVASDLLSVLPGTYAAGPSSGLASWTSSSFRAYRITITLDALAPDTSEGASAAASFNWQAQNT
jgi:hypothetical protein